MKISNYTSPLNRFTHKAFAMIVFFDCCFVTQFNTHGFVLVNCSWKKKQTTKTWF